MRNTMQSTYLPRHARPVGTRVADGMDLPRPLLAAALAGGLRRASVAEHAVAYAATELCADLFLCDDVARLSEPARAELRRAESRAIDALGVGLAPGCAQLHPLADGAGVLVVHGDGWSLVARTPNVLFFLLDGQPAVAIERSYGAGAAELIAGLVDRVTTPR